MPAHPLLFHDQRFRLRLCRVAFEVHEPVSVEPLEEIGNGGVRRQGGKETAGPRKAAKLRGDGVPGLANA